MRQAFVRTPAEEKAFRSYLLSSTENTTLPERSTPEIDQDLPATLHIMTWNVNGMRSLLKKDSQFITMFGNQGEEPAVTPARALST